LTYSDLVNGNIEWRKIEALFLVLGAEKDEGKGSAVTFIRGKETTVVAKKLLFEEKATGVNYPAYVVAQSRLLKTLSQ